MKYILVLLFLGFNLLNAKDIKVEVIVENHTIQNNPIVKLVIDNQHTITFDKIGKHHIKLKKGKHKFDVIAQNFIVDLYSPKRISEKNNKIVIKLYDKKIPHNKVIITENHTFEEIDSLYSNNKLAFLMFGLGARITSDMERFSQKYNISFRIMGCVVSNTENNTFLGAFLDKKFGTIWREDLKFSPIGVTK